MADRALYYRHDLAFADDLVSVTNPHGYTFGVSLNVALQAQAKEQVAIFFATDGVDIIQPEPSKYFEMPIVGPLPEDLSYIR